MLDGLNHLVDLGIRVRQGNQVCGIEPNVEGYSADWVLPIFNSNASQLGPLADKAPVLDGIQQFLTGKAVRRIAQQPEPVKPFRYPFQITEESVEGSEILPPGYAKDLGAILRFIPFCLASRRQFRDRQRPKDW